MFSSAEMCGVQQSTISRMPSLVNTSCRMAGQANPDMPTRTGPDLNTSPLSVEDLL